MDPTRSIFVYYRDYLNTITNAVKNRLLIEEA